MDEFYKNMDLNASTMYLNYAVTRAFAMWLDVLSLLYVTAIMLSFIMIKKDGNIIKLVMSTS